MAHLGFVVDDQPYVIPTLHARVGTAIYVHGSPASRAIRALGAGAPACLTVTHLDGFVLARSAFHHSVNYRSVVVLGRAVPVTSPAEKMAALEAFMERVTPGRWAEVRPPDARELEEQPRSSGWTSARRRPSSGPGGPVTTSAISRRSAWAGVIPIRTVAGPPEAAPDLAPGIAPSAGVMTLLERFGAERGD